VRALCVRQEPRFTAAGCGIATTVGAPNVQLLNAGSEQARVFDQPSSYQSPDIGSIMSSRDSSTEPQQLAELHRRSTAQPLAAAESDDEEPPMPASMMESAARARSSGSSSDDSLSPRGVSIKRNAEMHAAEPKCTRKGRRLTRKRAPSSSSNTSAEEEGEPDVRQAMMKVSDHEC
jgi:hypothetical protein